MRRLPGRWTSFRTGEAADLEVLEASDGPDNLWGDDRNNVIWGRGGGDRMFGLGGNDELLGADGNDTIVDNDGTNDISYGKGNYYATRASGSSMTSVAGTRRSSPSIKIRSATPSAGGAMPRS